MADAKRDNNRVTTLLAVSSSDGLTPVTLYADATTHRLLVSATAGTLDDLSDVVITSGAQGDIIYNNGTNWVNLAAGTSGKFLKTQGAGANPMWDTPSASAAGSDTQVQFNDGGTALGGDAGFVYNKTSNTATLDVIQLTNSGLKVLDSNASHYLIITPGSDISANRVFTITTGDAARTLSMAGNITTAADFITSGANSLTLTTSASTNVTLPTTGTLATLAGVESLSNKTLVAPALGTPASGTLTNCTGLPLTGLVSDTTTALGIGSINLGHASDTTITRVSAGLIAVEGVTVVDVSTAQTLTNKQMTTIEIGHASDTTLARVSAGLISVEGVTVVDVSTAQTLTNKQMTTIELGHASDTTLARVSAGLISVEGVTVVDVSTAQTLTNKTLTSPVLTTPSAFTTGGVITLAENTSIALDPAGSADGKYTGITIAGTAGATLAFGNLCYLVAASSRWALTDADAASTSGDVIIGMCVLAAAADGNATTILLIGNIRADAAFPALTIGAPAYVSTTAGAIQVAQPSGTDDVIRRVGFALTADELYFNPSNDYTTHT